jgi:transposase-like protein
VIRLVMMYVQLPLSLRNVEDLLFERGIDIPHRARSADGHGGLLRQQLAATWRCCEPVATLIVARMCRTPDLLSI